MNIESVFLTIFINYASLFLRYPLNPNPRYLVINKSEEYEKAERVAEEKINLIKVSQFQTIK